MIPLIVMPAVIVTGMTSFAIGYYSPSVLGWLRKGSKNDYQHSADDDDEQNNASINNSNNNNDNNSKTILTLPAEIVNNNVMQVLLSTDNENDLLSPEDREVLANAVDCIFEDQKLRLVSELARKSGVTLDQVRDGTTCCTGCSYDYYLAPAINEMTVEQIFDGSHDKLMTSISLPLLPATTNLNSNNETLTNDNGSKTSIEMSEKQDTKHAIEVPVINVTPPPFDEPSVVKVLESEIEAATEEEVVRVSNQPIYEVIKTEEMHSSEEDGELDGGSFVNLSPVREEDDKEEQAVGTSSDPVVINVQESTISLPITAQPQFGDDNNSNPINQVADANTSTTQTTDFPKEIVWPNPGPVAGETYAKKQQRPKDSQVHHNRASRLRFQSHQMKKATSTTSCVVTKTNPSFNKTPKHRIEKSMSSFSVLNSAPTTPKNKQQLKKPDALLKTS